MHKIFYIKNKDIPKFTDTFKKFGYITFVDRFRVDEREVAFVLQGDICELQRFYREFARNI